MSSNINKFTKFTKDMLRTGDRVTTKEGLKYYVSLGGTWEKDGESHNYFISFERKGSWSRFEEYKDGRGFGIAKMYDSLTIVKVEHCEHPQVWIQYLNSPNEWRTIWERKEEPRVTAGEIEAFRAIKRLYPGGRYIARDKDRCVSVYTRKPSKVSGIAWYVEDWIEIYDPCENMSIDLYPSIKWEDDEPVDMDAEIDRAERREA